MGNAMASCDSTSSDLAKGREFAKQSLYVQHVDKEKETSSKISNDILLNYILEDPRKIFDLKSASNSSHLNSNFDILKSAAKNEILQVSVYSNPLPIHTTFEKYSVRKAFNIPNLPALSDIMIHAFVVFKTVDTTERKINWWSIEKNGKYIILQQSSGRTEVCDSVFDVEKGETVKRLGPVTEMTRVNGNYKRLRELLKSLWDTSQLDQTYHFLVSNCQNFASFVFEIANGEGKKWSTSISGFGRKQTINPIVIRAEAIRYRWILKDDKFHFYKALIDKKDLAQIDDLITAYTRESINEEDAQGYTLLEWARAFSRDDVEKCLREKGAVQSEKFRQNVFFIVLQYWNSNRKMKNNMKMLKNFDGIDLSAVNKTGDTVLHLALHGAKWAIVEKILDDTNYDVNSINSLGETPLHLATKLKLGIGLFNHLLNRTSPDGVNKSDNIGFTPLHWATSVNLMCNDKIKLLLDRGADMNCKSFQFENTPLHCALVSKSTVATEILLKYVSKNADNILDVNVKNERQQTALHFAAAWPTIPVHLLKFIVEKSTDINVQDQSGNIPLNVALGKRSKIATENLLKLQSLDVNIKNIYNKTVLHFAAEWPDIPVEMFKLILEKTDDINSQTLVTKTTPLHTALEHLSATATSELLKHEKLVNGQQVRDADVNIKDGDEKTALHVAATWAKIPLELLKQIIDKSADINAQDSNGRTALGVALLNKSERATRELLNHVKCVDGVDAEDVDVNIKDSYQETALHLAALWMDIPDDLFKLIHQKSTNINAQNKNGETPLHLALRNKSKTGTEELLKCDKVDINIKDHSNETALHCAATWPDIPLHLFHTILEKTSDIKAINTYGYSPLVIALWSRSVNASDKLLNRLLIDGEHSCEGNLTDTPAANNNNSIALHLAASWLDIPADLFKKILDQSTDVINAKQEQGNTALNIALFKKSKTATQQLLKHVKCVDGKDVEDINVNVKGFGDDTALHLAVQWSDIPFELFQKILEKSTDVTAKNINGKTPLQLAEECKLNMRAIRLLRS